MTISEILHNGSDQHNHRCHWQGRPFVLRQDGGCYSRYLGVVRVKQSKDYSPRTFSIPYGILRESLPVVIIYANYVTVNDRIAKRNSEEDC
jgi:hypothetical protein